MVKLKSKLSILSAFSVTSFIPGFAISCGVSVNDIDNKIVHDNDTFNYFLQKNLHAPAPQVSQSANDYYIYADLFATLVYYDNYGRVQGNLAIRQATNGSSDNAADVAASTDDILNSKSRYVGTHNNDFTFYKYYLRTDANWSDSSGKKVATLEPSDFMNLMMAILYAPNNSPFSAQITGFVENSVEINNYFTGEEDDNGEIVYDNAYIFQKNDNGVKNGCRWKIVLSSSDTPPSPDDVDGIDKNVSPITVPKFDLDKENKNDLWKQNQIWQYLGIDYHNADGTDPYSAYWHKNDSNNNDDKTYKNNTVSVSLLKTCDYLDSLFCSGSYSPIPDQMMDINASDTIDNNLFKNIYLYSGAYYVTDYKVSNHIYLTRNNNFFWVSRTFIKNINWIISTTMTNSSAQDYFESGVTSLFQIQSSNVNAWNKYIGKDYSNTKSSAITETYDINYPSSWGIYFNYNYNSTSSISTEAKNVDFKSANSLLISDIARQYISLNLDRSSYVKGYCSLYDESGVSGTKKNDNESAGWLSNTLTADNLSSDSDTHDYTNYVRQEFENLNNDKGFGINNTSNQDNSNVENNNTMSDNGKDGYYGNEKLLNKMTDADGNSILTMNDLKNAVKNYIKSNKEIKTVNGKVQLSWLTQSNLRTFQYLKSMIMEFNNIPDNPIKIIIDATADADLYQNSIYNLGSSFETWGWSPDYSDPSTYLDTFSIGGNMSSYIGLTNIFKKTTSIAATQLLLSGVKTSTGLNADQISYSPNGDYGINDSLVKSNDDINKISDALGFASDQFEYLKSSSYWNRFIAENIEYENTVNISKNYNGNIGASGDDSDNPIGDYQLDKNAVYKNKKFTGYAVAESGAIYKNLLWLPMFRYAKYTPSLTYLTPYEGSTSLFGTTFSMHWNMSLNDNLIKTTEFKIIKDNYNKKSKIAVKDFSTFRTVIDWKQ